MACVNSPEARAQKLQIENGALKTYIVFLTKAYQEAFAVAHAHGYHADEVSVNEGRRLRKLAGLPEWPGNFEADDG